MIKNLISVISPTQQATGNAAPAEEGNISQKGVFGALMNALGSSVEVEQKPDIQLENNGEVGDDQRVMDSELTGDGQQFTVVVEKRSSSKEQSIEIENEQVVDSANVEGEPTFAPLVQNKEEAQKVTSFDVDVNDKEWSLINSQTEKEIEDETVATTELKADKKVEINTQQPSSGRDVVAVDGDQKLVIENTSDEIDVKPKAMNDTNLSGSDRLIEENIDTTIQQELLNDKETEPALFDEQIEVKNEAPVIELKEEKSLKSADVPAQEVEGKKVVSVSDDNSLTEHKESLAQTERTKSQTNAPINIESTPEIQTTVGASYESILPVKEKVQEVPVEEEIARELQKHERSVLSLRRNGHILGSSSELSAHGQKAKADFEDFIQSWKEVAVTTASDAQQVQMNEEVPQNRISNGTDFEKRPELLHLLQNIKLDEPKAKPAKDVKFDETKAGKEIRTELASETERMELNLTRKEGAGFLVHTSSEDEYFKFDSSLTLSTEQEQMLQEYMTEAIEGKDEKKIDLNILGYVRLGELPILNQNVRRALVSTVGKMVHQSVDVKEDAGSTSWQKHSFELEDGNSIDLTTRNVDGVLQIKLAASNPELNKLLQDASQDIREHLEKELDMQLDLQFNGQEQQDRAEFANDTKKGAKNINTLNNGNLQEVHEDDLANQSNIHTVRHFGYNQMEWTV